MSSNPALAATLAWGTALAAACGGLADGDYRGRPLALIQGTLTQDGPVPIAGELSFALLWAPAADHESALNLLGAAGSGPATDGSRVETCHDVEPPTVATCDGTAARGDRRCSWTEPRLASLLRVVDYQAHLPAGFEIDVRELPPEAARYDLSRQGGLGWFALASVVAFDDVDRDGAFRLGTPERPPEPTLADSGRQTYRPGPDRPRRSYLVAYLDGLVDHRHIDPALAEVLLFLPQGFSLWVEDQWVDEAGRTTATGRLWRPVDEQIDLVMPTQAVAGCETGTRRILYLPTIPDDQAPSWCSDDRFRATWSQTSAEGCAFEERRYSGDFACATSGSLPPTWSCPSPTTSSLVVSVATTGEDLDPDGYDLRIDGGPARSIGSNASVALPVISPGSHTVAIGGLAGDCAASASTVQVTAAAGSTAFVSFTVDCFRPGSIELHLITQGHSVDPDGFAASIDDAMPKATPINSVTLFSGLRPGIHALSLSGLASNCAVVTGVNPLEVEVLPDATVLAVLGVECTVVVGDVRVTTATSGFDQDQDGYTLTLCIPGDYGGAYCPRQQIAANASVTFQGVSMGLHYEPPYVDESVVSISGLARNCAVSGPSARPVPIVSGQTAELAFAVECVATGSLVVTTTTTGVDLDPDGYLVDWSGARQAETVAVPANGATAIAGLVPGEYQLTVRGIAPNCEGARSATATVVAGAAAPVAVDVTCAPDRGLAFVSYDDGNPEIYFIRASGTGATRLTVNPANDFDPAWSPDGARLAFTSDRDGNPEIYVMDADGSNVRRVTSEAAPDYSPAWSPDGTRIAFVSERNGMAQIHVMNADGSSPARLTDDAVPSSFPDWSPDGARIAFARGGRIWVMNANGSSASPLTDGSPDYLTATQPDWSPDGTKIAFARSYDCWTEDCWPPPFFSVIEADGTGERWAGAEACWPGSDPAWSPDGRHVAVTITAAYGFCEGSIGWVIRIATADGTSLADIAWGTHPAWRP